MTATTQIQEKVAPIANFCAPYSAVGALFMFWVGMMISKQPFFILGLEDLDECAENAFGAMWLFIVIFVGSICFIMYDSSTTMPISDATDFESESRPILPRGMSDYQVELSEMRGLESNLREIS